MNASVPIRIEVFLFSVYPNLLLRDGYGLVKLQKNAELWPIGTGI